MNLQQKIREMGVPAFSKAVGVTERAAMGWMYAQRKPRPEQARTIVKVLGLTWEQVYPPQNGSNAA